MYCNDFLRFHDVCGHQKVFGRFICSDLMVDCEGKIEIMDEGLTQTDGCVMALVASHVVAEMAEKWW